jgi:hypothetical protein
MTNLSDINSVAYDCRCPERVSEYIALSHRIGSNILRARS